MNLSDSATKKRDLLSKTSDDASEFKWGFDAGYEVGRGENEARLFEAETYMKINVEAVIKLQSQVQLLEDALKFYADGSLGDDLEIRPDKKEIWDIPDNWSLRSMSDHWSGKKARQALESLAKMRGEI